MNNDEPDQPMRQNEPDPNQQQAPPPQPHQQMIIPYAQPMNRWHQQPRAVHNPQGPLIIGFDGFLRPRALQLINQQEQPLERHHLVQLLRRHQEEEVNAADRLQDLQRASQGRLPPIQRPLVDYWIDQLHHLRASLFPRRRRLIERLLTQRQQQHDALLPRHTEQLRQLHLNVEEVLASVGRLHERPQQQQLPQELHQHHLEQILRQQQQDDASFTVYRRELEQNLPMQRLLPDQRQLLDHFYDQQHRLQAVLHPRRRRLVETMMEQLHRHGVYEQALNDRLIQVQQEIENIYVPVERLLNPAAQQNRQQYHHHHRQRHQHQQDQQLRRQPQMAVRGQGFRERPPNGAPFRRQQEQQLRRQPQVPVRGRDDRQRPPNNDAAFRGRPFPANRQEPVHQQKPLQPTEE